MDAHTTSLEKRRRVMFDVKRSPFSVVQMVSVQRARVATQLLKRLNSHHYDSQLVPRFYASNWVPIKMLV